MNFSVILAITKYIRMLRIPIAIAVLAFFICSCSNTAPADSTTVSEDKSDTVAVIFDTDMGPDYDDVGAIAMLHAFADEGSANILATIASTKYAGVAEVLDVFNTYFNRPDLPIGVPTQPASELRDVQHWTDSVRKNYPHSIKSNADAVTVYGRVPLFYYVLHFYILHFFSMLLFFYNGHTLEEGMRGAEESVFKFIQPGEGFGLGGVYLVWIAVVILLYPLCKWFADYKKNHPSWWVSYI